MEKNNHCLQPSNVSRRRISLGSLSSRKRNNNSLSHDATNSREIQRKLRPIAGGSWDDNSLGYGSVAARMRRDRNRAIIRRTNTDSTSTSIATDTSASVESTLNLINTTDLDLWNDEKHLFPWDDLADFYGRANTAASQRSAGSLCNISSPNRPVLEGSYHLWDSQSIPENRRRMIRDRSHPTYSYTAAHHSNHHSSPTSGCASLASSDIDSTDLAFFSVNDDSSSFFDGDSLFSDSYGVLDGCTGVDSGFSTDILSMLEDGNISCRTPFPNGDWPDSISELDFDCSEQFHKGSTISNCDAHSDIMPSSSSTTTDRNRLKKRKLRSKTLRPEAVASLKAFPDVSDKIVEETIKNQCQKESGPIGMDRRLSPDNLIPNHINCDNNFVLLRNPATSTSIKDCSSLLATCPPITTTMIKPPTTSTSIRSNKITDTISSPAIINLQLDLNLCGNDVTNVVINSVRAERTKTNVIQNSLKKDHTNHNNNTSKMVYRQPSDTPSSSPALKKAFKISGAVVNNCPGSSNASSTPVRLPITLNLKGWNYMTKEEREEFIERLSRKISSTMSLEEQLDIIRIIEGTPPAEKPVKKVPVSHLKGSIAPKTRFPFRMSVDDIDSHKLTKLLGYLDTHKGTSSLAGLFSASGSNNRIPVNLKMTNGAKNPIPVAGSSLRRSNSDSNLNIVGVEQQKETPRRKVQPKKFPRWMKQRQRKESRQLIREQRSGLFVNEQKLKMEIGSDDDICVDI